MDYQFVVDSQRVRLEEFLAERLPLVSLGTLRRAMVKGGACVNGVSRQRMWRLRPGDEISFKIEGVVYITIEPADCRLEVLWEDEHVVVVNKPPEMGTIPDSRSTDVTLISAVRSVMDTRPFVVHRLDKGTSGAIAVAKSHEAAHAIVRQFERRTVTKEYLAVVDGTPPDGGTVSARIGRVEDGEPRFQALADGQPAETEYETKERFGGFALVRARLLTGRTHQVRIHMAYMGHPLCVDSIYGRRTVLRECDVAPAGGESPLISRLTLHAWHLAFDSPSGKPVDVVAPLPADIAHLLEFLREHGDVAK
jgi:23S rRNA pseudouridine1911/1915/1917 synthase